MHSATVTASIEPAINCEFGQFGARGEAVQTKARPRQAAAWPKFKERETRAKTISNVLCENGKIFMGRNGAGSDKELDLGSGENSGSAPIENVRRAFPHALISIGCCYSATERFGQNCVEHICIASPSRPIKNDGLRQHLT